MDLKTIGSALIGAASGSADTIKSIFSIPGNIKQQYLPWVLEPDASLNSTVFASSDLINKNCTPQLFTYRNNKKNSDKSTGKINIVPSSYEKFMKSDIGNKLLFSQDGKSITYNDVFNSIPAIQIREFLPDTRLDQCLNIFGSMIAGIMKLFNNDQKQNSKNTFSNKDPTLGKDIKSNTEGDATTGTGKAIINTLWHAFNYLTGVLQPKNLLTNINAGVKNEIGVYSPGTGIAASVQEKAVLDFPYTLYYRMQSCTTTNIYELPFAGKNMYSSTGSKGWGNSNGISFEDPTSKIPVVGNLLKNVIGKLGFGGLDVFQNIRISMMPWWDSKSGSQASPKIEVKFDLFNDTADAAMINFILVNTLVPNNKNIQYGLMQHSSCLYDIKLEGFNRLFACTGDFTVNYKGVLRDPPPDWISKLVEKHCNTHLKFSGTDIIKTAKLIKIPDIYEVTLSFESLLPGDFNNYLYTYIANNNIIDDYKGKVWEESLMGSIVTAATTDLFNEMKAYINASGYTTDSTKDTKSYD